MTDYFLQLPADAISHVLHHLTIQGSVRVREVCRYLNTTVLAIINSPSYWQQRVATQLEGKKPYTGASHLMMSLALELDSNTCREFFISFLLGLNIPDITIYFVEEMSGNYVCQYIASHWKLNTRRRKDILDKITGNHSLLFFTEDLKDLPYFHIKDSLLPIVGSRYYILYMKLHKLVEASIANASLTVATGDHRLVSMDMWRCLGVRLPQEVFDNLYLATITYDDFLRYYDDVEVTRGLVKSFCAREGYEIAVEMGLLDMATPEVREIYRAKGLPLAIVVPPTNFYAAVRHYTRHIRIEDTEIICDYLRT